MPDNEFVLQRWAQRYHVSPRNAFALIGEVGEDCAGAVQFARPELRDGLLGGQTGNINWLSDADVADRLRGLQSDASAGRTPHDTGQFSLAGAQPKTALCPDGQRWGVPSGREPTTHILKPPTGEFDGHAENEHLCLAFARALGLPTARSEVRHFEDVTAIVIERYDRVHVATLAIQRAALAAAKTAEFAIDAASDEPVGAPMAARDSVGAVSELSRATATFRVHQEDLCQALSVHPTRKYQNDGGPGPMEVIDLLRAHASGARRQTDREMISGPSAPFWLLGGCFVPLLIEIGHIARRRAQHRRLRHRQRRRRRLVFVDFRHHGLAGSMDQKWIRCWLR